MNKQFSKLTSKSQTVIPKEIREKLNVKPGDTLRYVETDKGIVIEKAKALAEDDPFAVFTEWAGEEDEKAYGSL
jgi:antitoxin PrlF